MTWLSLVRWLKAIPVTFYATGALCAAMLASVAWHRHAVSAADARGYARAVEHARFDSALHAMADSARARAAAKTDTVIRVVRAKVARVDTQAIRLAALAEQLPPKIDTIPEVVALKAAIWEHVTETQRLTEHVDSLVNTITEERAATKVALLTRDNALMQSRLENARLAAHNAALAKRPTRKEELLVAALSATAGFTYGATR